MLCCVSSTLQASGNVYRGEGVHAAAEKTGRVGTAGEVTCKVTRPVLGSTGQWQGATIAVKYIVTTDGDSTTAAAAANEAVLGRLLAHPNVVQTFSAKTITIDGPFFDVSGCLSNVWLPKLESPGRAELIRHMVCITGAQSLGGAAQDA